MNGGFNLFRLNPSPRANNVAFDINVGMKDSGQDFLRLHLRIRESATVVD